MTHLSPTQFVDVIEGRVNRDARDADVAAHLSDCEICRTEVAGLDAVMDAARSVVPHEPSPLFWEHFSRRVSAAIEAEPMPQRIGIGRWLAGVWRPAAAISAALAALLLIVVLRPASPSHEIVPAPQMGSPASLGSVALAESVTDETGLSVMAALAQNLKPEELQQVARPSADATGAAIEDLTPDQCAELMRLVKAQLKGTE